MAQQDTGMGWSADQDWLTSSGPLDIGSIGGYELISDTYAYQPLPVTGGTIPEVTTSGLKVWHDDYNHRYTYASSSGEDLFIFISQMSSGARYVYFISKSSTASAYYADNDSFLATYPMNANVTISGETWYYRAVYYSHASYSEIAVPICGSSMYNPAADMIQAFVNLLTFSGTSVYKLNAGFAVTCWAKWIRPDGVIMVSPVLISTDENAVKLSTDGTTESADQYINIRNHEGRIFYMSWLFNLPNTKTPTTQYEFANLEQFAAAAPSKVFELLANSSFANITVQVSPDPYEDQTGPSDEGGGDGEEIQDDDVDFTPMPTSMAVASGFITLFCPSQYELNQLANYMWGPLFDVDTIKKLFANPMDCILGLSVYPFPISASGTKTVSVGGVSTTVSMGYTLQQYHIVDCGSVYVPKQWSAYMDYAPYTKFNIFLPYIGFRPVSADDIMGKTISLRYMVDILSGACNAELKCGSTVLYSWAGSCAAQIPITGNDWRNAITAGISIAGGIAATVLTQGAAAPMIAGTVASATVNSMSLKPEVQRSGSISGSSGFLAGQRPYLVRTNPRSAIPANQNKYSGYPSFVTILLGNLTGYNEVYSVHLENIPATSAELEEIESILKGGAIF